MAAPLSKELAAHAAKIESVLRRHQEAPTYDTLLGIAGLILDEYDVPMLTDEQLTELWVTLRLAIPELYQYAFEMHPFGCQLLFIVHGFDPTLGVAWNHLPEGLWLEYVNGRSEPDSEERNLQERIARLWSAAIERAKQV